MKLLKKEFVDYTKVRELCITNRYYESGTILDYENLLHNICGGYDKKEATPEKVLEVANDIYKHSSWEEYRSTADIIEWLCYEIYNYCVEVKIEIKWA